MREIDRLLRAVPGARSQALPLRELVEREAEALRAAHRAGNPATAYLVRSSKYRSGKSAETDEEILARDVTADEARASMARWHWFPGWDDVLARAHEVVDPRFEAACDAIVDGDSAALRALVAADPALVHERSRFAHHQTLLQHVAANGIENSRQWQSPPNAVEIARILLAAGAEPDATCDSYGGGNTAMTLLVTSAHPAAAGVQADLVEVLCRAGAKPDGPDDAGGPLWGAISFGYTAAVDRLVRCGARVDNLLFAAAAGDLQAVRSYFDGDGRIVPARAYSWGRARVLDRVLRDRPLRPEHALEYALHWAAMHRRRDVVELLLTKAPDLSVVEPMWNNTPLESARYGGDPAIVAMLSR